MAESLVVSPVQRNIKWKSAYLRMKNCSPKFRTILRQRYKERVENSRFRSLNNYRHIDSGDNENKLDQDYSHELSLMVKDLVNCNEDFNLDEELLLEEILYDELTQFENWLLQEYELLWNEDRTDQTIIICPLCCSGHLEMQSSFMSYIIYCTKCESSFYTKRPLLDIQNDIFSEVDEHNKNCLSDPAFVKVPRDETHDNLCIVCDLCGYLQIII